MLLAMLNIMEGAIHNWILYISVQDWIAQMNVFIVHLKIKNKKQISECMPRNAFLARIRNKVDRVARLITCLVRHF